MKDNHGYEVVHEAASRPGLKTLVIVIAVGIMIFSFNHWTEVKAAIDFFS